jgi:hypothetical protein
MANKFYFFTDFESFIGQSLSDRFGPLSNTQYKLDTSFDISSGAKIYAVCDGNVLIQTAPSGNLNIILRPSSQPKFNIGNIEYIIYRGVLASSLIDGIKVANRNNNDLTEYAWSNQEITDTNRQTGPNDASAQVLGANYTSIGLGTLLVDDSDTIDSVFFKEDDIQLIPVKAGDHIADFVGSPTKGNFEIITEKIGTDITMKTARLDENIFTSSTSIGSTNAQRILHLLEKEEILSRIDPSSFFGMFQNSSLNILTATTNQYTVEDIVQKFQNKNRIYLDIRSEFNLSYNVFDDFDSEIGVSLVVATPPVPLTFYHYYDEVLSNTTTYGIWPIFIIEDVQPVEFTNNNEHGNFLLELKNTGAAIRAVQFINGKSGVERKDIFCYPDQNFQFELSSWVYNDGTYNQFGSAVIKIKLVYEKRGNQQTFFPRSSDTLQTLFPMTWMQTEISGQVNDVIIKVWRDSAVVEHIEYPEIYGDIYTASLGIAEDAEAFTFFSYPSGGFGHKRRSELASNSQFITSKFPDGIDFFNVVHKTAENVSFELIEVDLEGFPANVINTRSNSISPFLNRIEPRYLNTINITKTEKSTIDSILTNAGFIPNTPVCLSMKVSQSEIRRIPQFEFRRNQLVLHGIVYQTGSANAEVEVSEVDTGVFVQTIIKKM